MGATMGLILFAYVLLKPHSIIAKICFKVINVIAYIIVFLIMLFILAIIAFVVGIVA